MSERYVILKGIISNSSGQMTKRTLIGIIDKNNYLNSVNVKDILTNKRISQALYNMGLQCRLEKVAYDNSSSYIVCDTVMDENITGFFEVKEFTSEVWYLDLFDVDNNVAQIVEYLKGIYSSDKEVNYILNKVCNTQAPSKITQDELNQVKTKYEILTEHVNPYDEIFENVTDGVGAYSCFDYVDGGNACENITVRKPNRTIEPIKTDMDELKVGVPEYKDIVGYYSSVLQNTGNSDDDEDESLGETHNFTDKSSNSNSAIIYNYAPLRTANGSMTANAKFGAGFAPSSDGEVPMFNLSTVKVTSVTPYFNYAGPSELPKSKENQGIFKTYENSKGEKEVYTPEDVTGHHSNNDLDIQPEEQAYFNRLKNLIDIGITIEQYALSDEVFNSLSDTVMYSEFAEYYLSIIAEQAFNNTQAHTATTRGTTEEKDLDDDDSDSSDAEVEIKADLHYNFLWGNFHYDTLANKYVYVSIDVTNALAQQSEAFKTESTDPMERMRLAQQQQRAALDMDNLIGREVGKGFTGGSLSITDMNKISVGNKYDEAVPKPPLTPGNLAGYVNESVNRYRWAEAVIKLLRFGRKKPKYLYISDTMREIFVKDYEIHQKVQKKIKFYYDIAGSVTTNNNPDITKAEVYNKIDGSDYKIAAFLTADLSRIATSKYSEQLSTDKPIIGAILMKEYNYGTLVKYEYVDIFTLLNTVFKADDQVAMIKFNSSTKNFTEIDKNSYKQYPVYLNTVKRINSANDIPIICMNNEASDITQMISKFISGVSDSKTMEYSYSEDGEEVSIPVEQDYHLDMAFKNMLKTRCLGYISKTISNIKIIGQIKQNIETNASKETFNKWKILGFILSIISQQRDYLDESLKYHDAKELSAVTQNIRIGNKILQDCMHWELLDLINKIATPDNEDILTRLEHTYSLMESALAGQSTGSTQTVDTLSKLKTNLENIGTISNLVTVKGHSETAFANEIVYRMLVPAQGSVKMIVVSEDVFNSLNIDTTYMRTQEVAVNKVSAKNIYNFVKTIINTMTAIKVDPANYQSKGVLAKDLEDLKGIWEKIQKCWGDPVDFSKICARKFMI
jgi:hypothetical protein